MSSEGGGGGGFDFGGGSHFGGGFSNASSSSSPFASSRGGQPSKRYAFICTATLTKEKEAMSTILWYLDHYL